MTTNDKQIEELANVLLDAYCNYYKFNRTNDKVDGATLAQIKEALAWFEKNNPLTAECARLEGYRAYNAELVRQRDEEIKRLLEYCRYQSELVDARAARIEKLREERDLYKPYYDAIIDMAVVHWTLDGLSRRDAHHAIQRIVLQHAQDMCDPQLNEDLAKLKERAETAEAENKALLKEIATHADNAKHWIAQANQWERMYSDILAQYERRDAQYLTASSGEQREGTRVYELENQITELRAELARLRSDENDALTAVYMAGRHDGRKQPEPVAVPQSEPTDAQIEALARVLMYCNEQRTPNWWSSCPEGIREQYREESRAAYEHLGAELAAVTAERDALRAELASLATRPCRVRFDVTADEFNTHFSQMDRALFEPEVIELIFNYLAAHAVADVPPGVPSPAPLGGT